MGISQLSLRLLAGGILILPVVLRPPDSLARVAAGTLAGASQETSSGTKKVAPKVWTNDDFPSEKTVQPAPRNEKSPDHAEAKPATDDSKTIRPQAKDPRMEKFEKMTPEERKALLAQDASDIADLRQLLQQAGIDLISATDEDHRHLLQSEINKRQLQLNATQDEVKMLRSLPPPKNANNAAEKTP